MVAVALGGTFDPIHNAHIQIAKRSSELLGDIDVELILAARPNLRSPPVATIEQRWEMLKLACDDHPNLHPNDLEVKRSGTSLTLDTVKVLGGQSDKPVVWILGTDIVPMVQQWLGFDNFRDYLSFLIAPRGDYELTDTIPGFEFVDDPLELSVKAGRAHIADFSSLHLSATEVRRQVANNMYVNGLVPYPVYRYMRQHEIYQRPTSGLSS